MSPLALLSLSFAMSTDAFAAAVGKGASLHRPRFSEALRTGVIFGLIESITPIIGWLLGRSASTLVENWDHWIAFAVLTGLGLHMVIEGCKHQETPEAVIQRHSFIRLALTAVGTSIDALAVGVGLAFVEVNILLAAGCIGLATLFMVTTGVMVGRSIGSAFGRRTEVLGGVILVLVGAFILNDHISFV
ncbi:MULTISPECIES: manganese efflux pump MntP [Marinimicrobium]|jgi:putative Mn2+ efflux pump MntP|uniref:Putative manganese efflux pump MntP n=1 Tax=Marinimicrobium koreense TaxID=306545 RepID=A0A3N1P0H6_9GAMM|nr:MULTISPECIES: manganese efflux pump MntP family protein [Marinimicrobium]ROQ21529.1 putative Mn2+ efflux pump MntP [Marinimicrobium koreense]UZJ43412.1 manganese efflux pump MntP family protein [Marinimicrobium sp. C6131]